MIDTQLGAPTLDVAYVIGWHVGRWREAERRVSEASGRMAA